MTQVVARPCDAMRRHAKICQHGDITLRGSLLKLGTGRDSRGTKPGTDVTRPHPVSSKLGKFTTMCSWLVNIHSALVMDATVSRPSKLLALLSSLGIPLHTHAIAIWNSLPSYIIQSSSASSPKFFKYHNYF